MRVCLIYTNGLVPSKGGGVASVISNIAKYSSNSINFSVLGSYDEFEQKEIKELYPSKIEIDYISSTNLLKQIIYYLNKRIDNFDVIHFHEFPFARKFPLFLKAKLKHTKLIYSHHLSLEELLSNRIAVAYYNSSLNLLGKKLDSIVVNSSYVANNDLSRFKALNNKIRVIRNGVDVDLIRSTKSCFLEGNPSFLFVGHLVYRKGIDNLLKAFKMLITSDMIKGKEPMLHIIGTGLLEGSCKQFVALNGLTQKIKFWGEISESRKFQLIKGADIIVVPSRCEPFGIVALEGMAAGKPLIATSVGGIPEIVKHGLNGILTNSSSEQIAEAMKTFCENKDLIEKYGKNNEKVAMSFDWRLVAQSYSKLYISSKISN